MRVAGLRRAKLRPAAVPCRNRKFSIQNQHAYTALQHLFHSGSPAAERWACTSGPAGRELQPSARGRLRAAGPDGPKRYCGLQRPAGAIQNSIFKIQHNALGAQPAERSPATPRSCGPPPAEAAARRSLRDRFCMRLRATGPDRPKQHASCQCCAIEFAILGQQPAEEPHERTRIAGLRRAEAAARRSLRDRICWQALPPKPRLPAADRCTIAFATKSRNRRRHRSATAALPAPAASYCTSSASKASPSISPPERRMR